MAAKWGGGVVGWGYGRPSHNKRATTVLFPYGHAPPSIIGLDAIQELTNQSAYPTDFLDQNQSFGQASEDTSDSKSADTEECEGLRSALNTPHTKCYLPPVVC